MRRIIQSWSKISTWKTGSLMNAPSNSLMASTCLCRIIRSHIVFPLKPRTCQNWSGAIYPDSPTGGVSDSPVTLCFLLFLFSDLDFICSSILSSFKCFSEFHSLSWVELEQVCMKSKANSFLVKLLSQEPPFIVRSRTKNYKIYTKSSVLHLLGTLESRNVLNLEDLSLCWWTWILRGSLFICDLMVKR